MTKNDTGYAQASQRHPQAPNAIMTVALCQRPTSFSDRHDFSDVASHH
ncbi:MAG: hypothetical protein WBA57_23265 [Elainellaceae cyanobacterium]